MQTDLSVASLILHASWLVKFVMLVLVLASLASWTIIFSKRSMMKRARRGAEDFENRFWNSEDLATLYSRLNAGGREARGMEKIFEAGFKEFARLRKREGIEPMAVLEGAQRAMRVAISREVEDLEASLPFLATVGSVSPYIGLFGTVWGIMISFHDIGQQGSASLAVVAPGISEALVATAIGLFAAIPAVMFYNHYNNKIRVIESDMETFGADFLNIVERHIL